MILLTKLSPLSVHHNWTIEWTRNPSFRRRKGDVLYADSKVELELLSTISKIGLIDKQHLLSLFLNFKEKKIKRLVGKKKIVPHALVSKKKRITFYTLGPHGALLLEQEYKPNYWREYSVSDVLGKILFYHIYQKIRDSFKHQQVSIEEVPAPFVGRIILQNQPYTVYVLRDNPYKLDEFLKWNEITDRVMIITESFAYLDTIQSDKIRQSNVRVTTDYHLKGELRDMFYKYQDGEWIQENQKPKKVFTTI